MGGGGIRSGEGSVWGCSQEWGGRGVRPMKAFLVNLYIGEMKVDFKGTHL